MRSWKRYAAALLFDIVLSLLILWSKGFDLKIYYVDTFSAVGGISVFLGLLFWVAAAGAFDTVSYGFSTFRAERRYKDLYEYVCHKQEVRKKKGKTYLPLIVVGGAFIALSLIISLF